MTDALKATLQITARAVTADAGSLVTLIDVDAIALARTEFIADRAHALEVALLIDALRVPAAGIWYLRTITQLAFETVHYPSPRESH